MTRETLETGSLPILERAIGINREKARILHCILEFPGISLMELREKLYGFDIQRIGESTIRYNINTLQDSGVITSEYIKAPNPRGKNTITRKLFWNEAKFPVTNFMTAIYDFHASFISANLASSKGEQK